MERQSEIEDKGRKQVFLSLPPRAGPLQLASVALQVVL